MAHVRSHHVATTSFAGQSDFTPSRCPIAIKRRWDCLAPPAGIEYIWAAAFTLLRQGPDARIFADCHHLAQPSICTQCCTRANPTRGSERNCYAATVTDRTLGHWECAKSGRIRPIEQRAEDGRRLPIFVVIAGIPTPNGPSNAHQRRGSNRPRPVDDVNHRRNSRGSLPAACVIGNGLSR